MEISEILDRLASLHVDKNGKFSEPNLQVVTAVFLMYVAKSDAGTHPKELESVQRALAKHFSLPDEESAHVIEVADFLLRQPAGLQQFADTVNLSFESSQRRTILALMWKVMKADGLVNALETKVASEIVRLFQLTAKDLNEAKQLVDSKQV